MTKQVREWMCTDRLLTVVVVAAERLVRLASFSGSGQSDHVQELEWKSLWAWTV